VDIIGPKKWPLNWKAAKILRRPSWRTISHSALPELRSGYVERWAALFDNPQGSIRAQGRMVWRRVRVYSFYKTQEAQKALKELLDGQFGEASKKVVIEEFLKGVEMSVFIITDGDSYKYCLKPKDYKRIGEGIRVPTQEVWALFHPYRFAAQNLSTKLTLKSSYLC
jgi:hypothetical protein